MIEISLTDFVDFVAKSGTPRLTHVRNIKSRGTYDPAEDFWRAMRNRIVEFHRTGGTDKKVLKKLALNQADSRKTHNYSKAAMGYSKFLGRKRVEWFEPPTTLWQKGSLAIRINPELGLIINGTRHIIKLYFKGTPLGKNKADMLLLLMSDSLFDAEDHDQSAIIDVQRSRLLSALEPSGNLMPLLKGEALAFQTIWNELS